MTKEFWDSKADCETSSEDRVGTELEMRAISEYVRPGMRILDAGCGNGGTIMRLKTGCEKAAFFGIDSSPRMIQKADESFGGKAFFLVRDVRDDLRTEMGLFDLVYTQRCLINLSSWWEQYGAMQNLIGLLRRGGRFVLCENSFDALSEINRVRSSLGLESIPVPWHNLYFWDATLSHWRMDGAYLREVRGFTSTYYFLSRIVNAHVAREQGSEPDYGSPINRLALDLSGDLIRGFSQTKLWVWEKV